MRRRGGFGKFFNRSRRAAMSSRRGFFSPRSNQRNMAQAAKRAKPTGPAQQARKAPTRPTQVGAMQAQKAAVARRQGMSPSSAQANRRNMAQAQRVAASKSSSQQARKAPAGRANQGARQTSAFNKSQERAMNALRQTPSGPGGMQALQAKASSTRQRQVGSMQAKRANEVRLIEEQKRAASKSSSQQARKAPAGRANQGARQMTAFNKSQERAMARRGRGGLLRRRLRK